ncbi:ribonuclease J [Rhodospirillum rubrum]|uniref:Metallo-beta-lactamase n=1 Tax=Rhodospirillum rubrum (strain ATCC 11170 / ATH 1.1.1 / DSM 467 / LMG 4362 / NCIMB 8255 / S1) TaxID=269796 RepID=Q2RU24_RHORT|nr:ribonuclease J [Rhodospirillum rubrum]ABC22371.1 metallo-beta-lactamase [Rhodospirillum rubrum ATCC 11170]AEO48088.1 metallo-beta-lactamase [Rhodospirillum rubrum F11]MBK1663309.1 MBL fold hydrolase [Rhodospirillum rubrum]MBK1675120.1 MBL fold hydrolase [Rhodospirillum rubrum]MBK5953951.1 MBL fold hydrolase [Rhodospirillum rubrum]
MADNSPPVPPRFEKNALYFVPLGGAGEIGMNLNLYAHQGKWLMVDLGVTFGNETTPGVDIILPDPSFIEERKGDLVGLVLTHAHEDHVGAVAYLWPYLECPVYATPFTAEFLRHKLREEGIEPDVKLIEIPLGGRFTVGPFDIEMITTTHSIPEPNHLAIRTTAGTVLHTADWKFDPEPLVGPPADEAALRRLGDEGVLAMVGDSTNIFTEGHSASEGDVRRSMIDLFARFQGRIAVGCFASNIARMETIALAAKANGREVALVGRSLWRMMETARTCGYLKGCPAFLGDEEAAKLPRDKVVYICTGSQGEPRAALKRIASGSHPYVSLSAGDVVIFSSRVIPGNERSILQLQNQLVEMGVKLITSRDAMVHVSGHPGAEEVRSLYGMVRPSIALPVHGEFLHLDHHADVARDLGVAHVVRITNGAVVRLDGAEPTVVGKVPFGRLALDGDRLLQIDCEIIRDRKRMGYNGSVAVSLAIDDKGKLLGTPKISARGLLDPEDDADEVADLTNRVRGAVNAVRPADRKDDAAVAEAVRLAVRRVFRQGQNRRPVTDIHVLRV